MAKKTTATKNETIKINDILVSITKDDKEITVGIFKGSDKKSYELSVEKVSTIKAMKSLSSKHGHDLDDLNDDEKAIQEVYRDLEMQSQIQEFENLIDIEKRKAALVEFQSKLTFKTNSDAVAGAVIKLFVIDKKPMPTKRKEFTAMVIPVANMLMNLEEGNGMSVQGSSELHCQGAVKAVKILKELGLV